MLCAFAYLYWQRKMQRIGEFSGKLAAINTCQAVIWGFVPARKGSIPSLRCPGIYLVYTIYFTDAVFYGIPKCDMQAYAVVKYKTCHLFHIMQPPSSRICLTVLVLCFFRMKLSSVFDRFFHFYGCNCYSIPCHSGAQADLLWPFFT